MKHAAVRLLVAVAFSLLGLPAYAQTLTWPTPTAALDLVGGTNSRNGVATAVFKNAIWVAYTSDEDCTGSDCAIIVDNNGGGSGAIYGQQSFVYYPQFANGYAVSNNNPALAVVNVGGTTPTLFLAFSDSYGEQYLMSTTTGTSWSLYVISGAYGAVYGPTLAANPSDSTQVYVGYMNGSTYNPILCTVNTSNPNTQTCQNLTGLRTMNFQPGMAFWNGLLYMAYEDRGDSHCLYGYTYNPSTNSFTTWQPIGCSEQTSTAPSLAVHNGYLYVAFRTNDSSQKFTVRVSTNGSDLAYRQQPGWSMAGPPALLDLNQLSPAINILMNGLAKSNAYWTSNGQ